ncbi:MAG TPA: hypothetical protein VN670_03525 [Acidobacteriaceae bacterium]|nr:hypothetical protein [Acidobacteriaceae bacterium]
MVFSPIFALFLFPAMVLLLELGRRVRIRRKVEAGNAAIEGTVFALFGLLLAFTFSGAMTRYDAHRNLIVEETNNIGTAYRRLDLLPTNSQPGMRQLFREYATSRLHLYDTVAPEISAESLRLQDVIWQQAVQDCSAPGANPDATKLLLPALNSMFDITAIRQNVFNMHPPAIVYLLLFVLSLWCAFMAGCSMSGIERNGLYIVGFALAVTLTIYATLEIEYPRRGLIRLIQTDQSLVHLRDSMK